MGGTNTSTLKIVERLHTAATLEQGFEAVADNVVVHDWTKNCELRGKEALLDNVIRPSDAAFTDGSFEIEHMFADDTTGMVVVDAVYRAVFTGDYKGISAHGGPVSWRTRDMFLVEGGQVTRMWYGGDTLEMVQVLGAVDFELPS